MDIERVTSADDFITFVRGLVEMATSYDGPLEKYLSSVLRTVSRHSDGCGRPGPFARGYGEAARRSR